MTDSAFPPAPVRRIVPGEEVITSRCLKCGNEIRLAVTGMTRAQVEQAVATLDGNIGECPGGFHVELGGWRKLWQLDKAVADYFRTPCPGCGNDQCPGCDGSAGRSDYWDSPHRSYSHTHAENPPI